MGIHSSLTRILLQNEQTGKNPSRYLIRSSSLQVKKVVQAHKTMTTAVSKILSIQFIGVALAPKRSEGKSNISFDHSIKITTAKPINSARINFLVNPLLVTSAPLVRIYPYIKKFITTCAELHFSGTDCSAYLYGTELIRVHGSRTLVQKNMARNIKVW
jgi:hypothetical protein